MNQDQFKQYIQSTRDCDAVLLDIAVNKGLLSAKNEGLDFKKFINLVAMCAVTAVLCITMNSEPMKIGAADFLLNNSLVTQSGSEVLYGYLSGITSTLTTYFGGN